MFQLYRGNGDGDDEEESQVAFEGVNAFLGMILSSGKDDISEQVLGELIKPVGPLVLKDALCVLIKRNMVGSITHHLLAEFSEVEYEDGEDLLHLATKKGRGEIVEKLMSVLNSSNTGSKERIIERGNTNGDTPLAIAARLGYLSVVMTLLLENADPNCINRRSGYTPLHYASENGHREVVQALLVFGADPQLKNEDGCLPSDMARLSEHPEILHLFQQMNESKANGTASDDTEIKPVDPKRPMILSIDGGGIRGLVSAIVLRELEDKIRALNPTCESLSSYFDYMAGTSTGSFIALCLSHGNKSMRDIIKMYLNFKDVVLPLPRPFSKQVVDESMKQVFGEDVHMADKSHAKVMVMTCKADVSPPILHIMRNYGEPQDGEVGPTERKVWEAARASSAAPTYFPAFGKFLDGGLMANNPTVDCIGEVIDDLVAEGRDPSLGLVVSIGTGSPPRRPAGDLDIPNVNWLDPTDIVKAAVALKNFLGLVVDQVTVSGGRQVERSISWCASMNCPFYRLDLPLEKEIDLAEHKDEIIIDMMFQSLLFSKRMNSQLDAIAQILCSKAELSKTHEMNESGGTMTDQHACIVSGTPSVLV
jgi:calcium-independent phospholipase A2